MTPPTPSTEMARIPCPVLGRIQAHPRRITSYDEARSISGISHRTEEKVLALALSHFAPMV